jgi:hypothetical protein
MATAGAKKSAEVFNVASNGEIQPGLNSGNINETDSGEQHIEHDRYHDQAENHCRANQVTQKSGSRVISASPQNQGLQDPKGSTDQKVNGSAEGIFYVDEQSDDGVRDGDADAVAPESARQRDLASQRVS